MVGRDVLVPGPDHPITIEPTRSRVRVVMAGRVVADSDEALTLREASYPPVQYLPRRHVDMAALRRTSTATYCPYKGEASYYRLSGEDGAVDAGWSYERPHEAVAAIVNHVAFYPDRVDSIELQGEAT